jgi:hypothetical protein
MIFIDDDTWPPSLHGTGMEDYFGHAWGMQHNSFAMNGTMVHEDNVPGFHHSYRFHITDPIRFKKRFKVTFEHGHANHLSDDWSSTAYWYQTLPSPRLEIPDVEERLPLRPIDRVVEAPLPNLSADQKRARGAAAERMEKFVTARDAMRAQRKTQIDEWEKGNLDQARRIRAEYDQPSTTDSE